MPKIKYGKDEAEQKATIIQHLIKQGAHINTITQLLEVGAPPKKNPYREDITRSEREEGAWLQKKRDPIFRLKKVKEFLTSGLSAEMYTNQINLPKTEFDLWLREHSLLVHDFDQMHEDLKKSVKRERLSASRAKNRNKTLVVEIHDLRTTNKKQRNRISELLLKTN